MPFDNKMLAVLRAMGIGSGGGGSGGGGDDSVYIMPWPKSVASSEREVLKAEALTAMKNNKTVLTRSSPTGGYFIATHYYGTTGKETIVFIGKTYYTGAYHNTKYSVYEFSMYGTWSSTDYFLSKYSFGDTTTATAADIAKGKTAYTNTGNYLTGTHECTDYPTAEEASF